MSLLIRDKEEAERVHSQCSFSSDDPKTPLRTPLKTPLMTACLPFQSFQKVGVRTPARAKCVDSPATHGHDTRHACL